MRFVDSHLHLDGRDAEATVGFASSAGVLLLACAVNEKTSTELLGMAGRWHGVIRPFVGVHPSEAVEAKDLGWLRQAVKKASGLGEIGLDPAYSPTAKGSSQMAAFMREIDIAESQGKPVEVHSRGAERECLDLLGSSRVPRVLMHWLESEEALPEAMDRGYYVSFSPALLYSKKLQRIGRRADSSRILLESDSPVAYAPLGGVRGPMLIPSVAFKLAELRGEDFSDTLAQCGENSLSFLGEKG